MYKLRFWIIGLLIWFFLLFTEIFTEGQINFAPFLFLYALICAVLIINVPYLYRIPLAGQMAIALGPFLLLRIFLTADIKSENWVVIIAEIGVVILTVLLCSNVGRNLENIHHTIIGMAVSNYSMDTPPFNQGQAQIYREIRRARRYHRPVSLLAITVDEENLHQSEEQLLQEAQHDIIKQYANARLAHFLVAELHDTDLVLQRNDHFVILLPETDNTGVKNVVKRLEKTTHEKLGIEIKVGMSSFPTDEITFESLLAHAENEMISYVPFGQLIARTGDSKKAQESTKQATSLDG